MSLAIDPEKITAVLLGGQWYQVNLGSFAFDAFEFVDGEPEPVAGLGQGFRFEPLDGSGRWVCAPVGSIQAVETS